MHVTSFTNELTIEIQALWFDVKVNFHHLPNVKSFARFFEMDHQEVLLHVVTRWLSLLPAVECILHSRPAPRSNFPFEGDEQRSKVLR